MNLKNYITEAVSGHRKTKVDYIDYKVEKINYESTMDFVVYTLQDIGYKYVGDNKNIQFNIFFDMFGNYGGMEFMILRRSARNEIIVSNKNKELLVSMSFDSKTNNLREICSIQWARNKKTYMVEDLDIPELHHYISFGTLTESKVTEAVSHGRRKEYPDELTIESSMDDWIHSLEVAGIEIRYKRLENPYHVEDNIAFVNNRGGYMSNIRFGVSGHYFNIVFRDKKLDTMFRLDMGKDGKNPWWFSINFEKGIKEINNLIGG